MDNRSITHTRWNCTYHIVFIPKYRRKIMYGETKRDLVIRNLIYMVTTYQDYLTSTIKK